MNVLVIEDDARIADFLQRGLSSEGHRVQVARSGPEGLAMAMDTWRLARDGGPTTLILLDVMLPGMNGLELCQTLRLAQVQLPILMLTAMSTVEDRVSGLRMGADDYLCKPFDFDELLARMDALQRRGRDLVSSPSEKAVVDTLVLDRSTMRVTRGGSPITLTARELALLELLMSSPGRLFSRERIIASVWGTTEDPLTNIVDVYIRRLRTKIDGAEHKPLIHTVRGLGYRLEALE